MLFRKHEHNIPEKRYPHTEGDFSLAGLSFREKIRKIRRDHRGIEAGQLIWIVVGVLAATGIGIFIFQQVTDTGETVESAGGTEIATYDANCNGQTVGRIAVVATPTANDYIDLPFNNNASGYGQPVRAAGFDAADPGAVGVGSLRVTTVDGRVAFLRSVDALTEAAHNADFNNDGDIDPGEVVALLTGDAATPPNNGTVAVGEANDGDATTPIGPAVLTASPPAAVNGVRVGSEIVVDRINACWGVQTR